MTQTSFRCDHCAQMFNSKDEMDEHMRNSHQTGGDTRMNRPGDTGRGEMDGGAGGGGAQARDMGRQSEMGAGMGRQSDMGGSTTGTAERTGTFRCEACGSEFRSRSEWEDHGRTAHNR